MNPRTTVIPYPRMQYQQVQASRPQRMSGMLHTICKLLRVLFHNEGWLVNIVALLLGRVSILGEISPFGLAFFAAVTSVNREKAVGVAIWTIVGLFTTQPGWGGLAAVFAIVLFFRLLRGERVRPEKKLIAYPVLMFGCALAARLIMTTITNPTMYGYVLALFDATITLVLTLVFVYGAPMVTRKEMGRTLSSEEMVSVVGMLAAVVAGIPHVVVAEISIANVVGRLMIMIFAFIGGGSMGAAIGVAVGIVSSLSEASVFAGIGFYAFAGLLAGLFRPFGKLGVGVGFVIGNLILTLYMGQASEIIYSLAESMIAMVGLLVIPKKQIFIIKQMIPIAGFDTEYTDAKLRELSLQKLQSFALVFGELSTAFGQTSTTAKSQQQEDLVTQMLGTVGEKVCTGCSQQHYCWERDFYRTYRSLADVLVLAEVAGGISQGKLPANIKANCSRQQELVTTINLLLERQQAYSYWQRKVWETRCMITEQMRGMSSILENFSREMKKDPYYNEEVAQIIREKADELSYPLDEVQVIGDYASSLQIEICKSPCGGSQECVNSIVPLLGNLLQEKFSLRTECARDGKRSRCYLKLTTEERFHIVSGIATAAKDVSGVSGDTYSILPLRQGKVAIMLSDGMGIGSDAAHQSSTTINLLQKLLTTGFDLEVAVKTVNSMLLLHTPEETFATVDLVVLDLYTAQAEFLKIGSSPAFIKRVREVSIVRSTSLPIGILNHIEIESTSRQLVAGDIIVMVTDGILDAEKKILDKEEWVAKALRRIGSENPREIADSILRQAKNYTGGEIDDDMTVLAFRLDEKLILH
jgi:stage II sporulation protein E